MQKHTLFLTRCLLALTLVTAMLAPQGTFAHDSTLQSSDTLYQDKSYEDELAEAVTVLNLGDISNVTSNLVLPYSYGIHVNIDWKSSDETVIDLKGRVTTPTDKDEDVTLTAALTSTKLDVAKTKEFKVHVPKASTQDVLTQDARTAHEYIDYIINTGYTLPDSKELSIRSDVTWEITFGEAEIKDSRLVKTDKSAERQLIELKATLTYEGEEKTVDIKNIVLIDEYAGYILSYFAGKNESKEMYLGYSYDGVHWMRLNSADAVLTPKKGIKQIRDPFIMRKKDGSFAIFATNGWSSPMITIWDSDNLETFENERLCKLSEKGGVASGFHTWAPECNYDPITDQYYVYWSDPDANGGRGQIYYNTTADLENYSEAGVFFEREFFIIDASIKKYKGDYYMVYDDATGDNDTGNGGRRIYAAKADSLEPGAFYPYCGVLSEGVAEGPFLFQNFKDGSWFAYYDYYSKHKFGFATIKDLTTDDWVYQGICETMPWEEVRHGGVIPVTQKELDRILAKWANDTPELLSVATPEAVQATAGSDISALKLPATASATLSDGNVIDVPITWDTKGISLEKEGQTAITGKLASATGTAGDKEFRFTNENNLTVQTELRIEKASPVMIYVITGITAATVIVIVLIAILIVRSRQKIKK